MTSVPTRTSRHSWATFSTGSTETNASTIWGPGTLTGKALEAFGEATLRGIENIAIRRKLIAIRSVFPHTDNTNITNINTVYDDVLELSRAGLYPKNVTRAALRLITLQITSQATHHLCQCLWKWPSIELRFFMSQLMETCMSDCEKRHDGRSSKTKAAAQSLVPMIKFISFVAQHSDEAGQAVLDGGFLNMLLRIYVLFPTFDIKGKNEPKTALPYACLSALLIFSREPHHLEVISAHSVCTLWTQCGELFRIQDTVDFVPSRCVCWRRTEKPFIVRRLETIYSKSLSTSSLSVTSATEVCSDLLEFSRLQIYDSEITELAVLAIFKCITVGSSCKQRLISALTTSASYQDALDIFSRVLRLWLEYIWNRDCHEMGLLRQYIPYETDIFVDCFGGTNYGMTPVPDQVDFHVREKSLLFQKIEATQHDMFPLNDLPLHNIIDFVIAVANNSMAIRWSLVDAGVLTFVLLAYVDGVPTLLSGLRLALTQQIWHDHSEAGFPHELDAAVSIPLALINAEASKILHLIQAPRVQALLRNEIFNTRRAVCSSLLNNLLGDGAAVDDVFTETRHLFAGILANENLPR